MIIAGASLWLGAPEPGGPMQWLTISKVLLWHNGSATFSLHNAGLPDVVIIMVRVLGRGLVDGINANLFSGNVVPYKSSLNLTTYFPTVSWLDRTQYNFTLTDANGNQFTSIITA